MQLQCEGADACAFTGTIGGSGALEGSLTAPGSADPLPYALDRTGGTDEAQENKWW